MASYEDVHCVSCFGITISLKYHGFNLTIGQNNFLNFELKIQALFNIFLRRMAYLATHPHIQLGLINFTTTIYPSHGF